MNLHVETISKQLIKPSSETPHHLRKLRLSYLDQTFLTSYTPVIFFFEADESNGLISSDRYRISQHLKQSLSDALTSFYPLAGRIESKILVDCNDAGVEFIEAQVRTSLVDALGCLDAKDMKHFLPCDPIDFNGTLVLAKVTFFDCRSIAIGLCISHKLADCASIMAFINAWAAANRRAPHFARFSFNLGSHFPTRDLPEPNLWTISDQSDVAKVFTFSKEMLAALKHKATSTYVENPTRVEAVSAFIWKNFLDVIQSKSPSGSKVVFPASQAMNLRPRVSPPLEFGSIFGNCCMAAFAFYDPNRDLATDRYQELVRLFRNAMEKIDEDFIREAQLGDSYVNEGYKLLALHTEGELREGCAFTSWCNFQMYEVDFGWGYPLWVASAMPMKNSVVLIDTSCGEAIDVWVNMDKDVVERLDKQIKLISSNSN